MAKSIALLCPLTIFGHLFATSGLHFARYFTSPLQPFGPLSLLETTYLLETIYPSGPLIFWTHTT